MSGRGGEEEAKGALGRGAARKKGKGWRYKGRRGLGRDFSGTSKNVPAGEMRGKEVGCMGEGEGVRGVLGWGEGVGNTEAESGEVEAQHEGPGKGFDDTSLGEASRGQHWQQWQELQGPLLGLWLAHLQFSSPLLDLKSQRTHLLPLHWSYPTCSQTFHCISLSWRF